MAVADNLVRRSCAEFVKSPSCLAKPHAENIVTFLDSIDPSQYASILSSEKAKMALPLQFTSDAQKWNFYSLLHMLNFGSGWRRELKAQNGMGAFDNMIRLLISAHISDVPLNVSWMASMTVSQLAEMMSLRTHVEVPVNGHAALQEMQRSPVLDLLELIQRALHETAATLQELGHETLIDFVTACISQSSNLNALLLNLSRLAIFNDAQTLQNGERVYIFKKMQVMLSELMRNGLDIPYVSQDDLSIFADNVIPTMLQHSQLISCPSADDALATGKSLTMEQALSLRAASIVICPEICAVAKQRGLTWVGNEVDLDNYLWKVAKEDNLRKLPRYVDKHTYFY